MIDNYVNTLETITLYIYSGGSRVSADATPTATATNAETGGAVALSSVLTRTHPDGYDYYEVTLDPSEITTTKKVILTWEYVYNSDTYNRIETINVVRPYFEPTDFWDRYPEFDQDTGVQARTYDEIQNIERLVRKTIDTYCRQQFQDFGLKTIKHRGNGTNSLQLKSRIYYLESVKSKNLVLFDRDQNGDIIAQTATWNEDEPHVIIKDTPETTTITFTDKDPFVETVERTKSLFRSDRLYEVEAKYGWQYLPSEIYEAAMMLANDRLSTDDDYRKKNIVTLRSADYRMEYGADHHSTTGNVEVDHLLSNYVNIGVNVF